MSKDHSREDLGVYLQDHHAGGVGALELLDHLIEERSGDPLQPFLCELRAEIEADHDELRNLMTRLGYEDSSLRDAGAWLTEKFSRVKVGFATSGASPLRLLESLEALLLGITGKKFLWRALAAIQHSRPLLEQVDLARLEARAVAQADRVDTQRLETARAAFRSA